MAKIPHSSQYRPSGNKASANVGAAGRAGSARTVITAHIRAAHPPSSMHWVLWLVALVLLIAFPYQMLGVIGLGLLAARLFRKK